MNAKKQREKCRRRAGKLAEQAWEAADDGNLELAVKIIRRVVNLNPANPVLWNDQGMLLLLLNEDDEAAASFQAAICAAPDFSEAYASLASIRIRQGMAEQAVALQHEAVRRVPTSERLQSALAAYEALLVGGCNSDTRVDSPLHTHLVEGRDDPASIDGFPDLKFRIESLDWRGLDDTLTRYGLAHIPNLLGAERCAALRAMFDDDRLFAKTVTMNKNHFGKGVYRHFGSPIPDIVDAIRCQVYAHLAEIANRWQLLPAPRYSWQGVLSSVLL